MKKRLAIYLTYDSDGIIDDYIVYILNALQVVCDDIIVVSNTYLDKTQKKKLKCASRIYERDNSGFDVGAYAQIITLLHESKEIDEYQELILLNDSVFGPFYDLQEMFDEMDRRSMTIDFWGITRRGCSDFDGGDEIYPQHIQSYCYIFRNKILHSNEFFHYWEKICTRVTDFRSAILNYEFHLTQYFSDLGYSWDSYCKCNDYITENPRKNLSPYHYGSYELIKKDKCPFLKRKLFTGDFIENRYTDARDLREAVSYIDQMTEYDVNLIWKYILRKYSISQIIKSMQMIDVVDPSSLLKDFTMPKGIYFVDVFQNVIEETNASIFSSCKYILFLSVRDDGDIVPLKKSYINNLKYNLCYNAAYIYQLVQMFDNEKKLGVIIPPMDMYGKVSNSYSSTKFPTHKINGFMCRKKLISEKLLRDMKRDGSGDSISMLPKLAQEKGYYTKIVINKEYVSTWMINSILISNLMFRLNGITDGQEMDIDEIQDTYYKKEISNFVKNNQSIYIYGAGQLACRVIDLVEEVSCIKGLIVSDTNGNSRCVKKIRVLSFDDFFERECGIIVAVGEKNNKSIVNKLEQRGFSNYLVIN